MVYLSRYANKTINNDEYVPLAISLGLPKWPLGYELQGVVEELAPKTSFRINDYQKSKEVYFRRLESIGAKVIKRKVESFAVKGKHIVLLCYEDVTKEGEWCHRQQFAEWWKMKTGQELKELHDENSFESQHQKKLDREENLRKQLSLFDMRP